MKIMGTEVAAKKTKVLSKAKGQKNWQEHELDSQPLTVICHQNDIDVKPDPKDMPEMNSEVTTYHGERVVKIDPDAIPWIEYLQGYPVVDIEDRALSDKHIIGLVDLLIKFAKQGLTRIFIKEPETHLHPKQQARIMNFISALMKAGAGPSFKIKDPPTDE